MKIAIGADHRGFMHKEKIKQDTSFSVEWIDVGTHDETRTDYPIYAHKVVELIIDKEVDCAVLLCSSGSGMAIAANRYKHMYAAVAWSNEIAQQCKQEDNANVLVLPSDFVSVEQSVDMIKVWLAAEFKGGRYAERIAMID